MRLIFFLLTSMLLVGQVSEYPKIVTVNGLVYFDNDGFITEVKECLVKVSGFESPIMTMTDSSGSFSVDLPVSKDYYLFNFKIQFKFSKQLPELHFATAHRSISAKDFTGEDYNFGLIYLVDPDTGAVKPPPTVWDMLEDSLSLLHLGMRNIETDVDKLNIRLVTSDRQNSQYQKYIADLELQSDEYYDQIIELQSLSEQNDLDLMNLQSQLEKSRFSASLVRGFTLEKYLDIVRARDSVITRLDSSVIDPEYSGISYDSEKPERNIYIQRQDLFADFVGFDVEDELSYANYGSTRDSLLASQDSLTGLLDSYGALSPDREAALAEQDALVLAYLKRYAQKPKTGRTLYDNIFVEHYFDMIAVRDLILTSLDESFQNRETMLKVYTRNKTMINGAFMRQDLLAKYSGIKSDDSLKYINYGVIRDSLMNIQNQLAQTYYDNQDNAALYQSLSASRTNYLAAQDLLVLTNVIDFNQYELHEVMPGDYLWNIAKQHPIYSDPYAWRILFMFNKDQIANPDSIYPGQILKVPIQGPDQD
ncbi:MAG: LysM peptidoglycan-binding domain-containing protein [Candidatus Marinimicrobia bacterium]|nr:LysM peptidoglycan-binding domain-containing protein [Candidatus Neomarinimicrobiota bacterium]